MNPDQWDSAKEIFGAAIELEPSQREAFVRNASQGDQGLFDEVLSLLRNDLSKGVAEAGSPLVPQSSLLKGRYRVERELGRGGLGVVYLARDEALHNRQIVVKMPLSLGAAGTWQAAKFAQEIKALALIDHPGVVGALDTGVTDDGRPFCVMQYVEGQPLRAAISPDGLPLKRVAVARQIGQALAAAHSKGIWHRDLKPENIMLQALSGEMEHVRIIDFGIATIREVQTKNFEVLTHVIGSPAYMAPEQLQGRVSAATDIYAFGAVMYEMLTGRKPFIGDDPAQLLSRQEAGVGATLSQLRPELPHAAEALILQALSFDPKDRPKNAAAFGQDLAAALAGADAHPLLTRRRAVVMTALGGTSLIVIAAGTAWWRRQQRSSAIQAVTYSVLVQTMREGQPAGMPKLASMDQPLRPSDNFVLLIRAAQSGHVYVLSEEQSADSLNTLFPSPATYHGSSALRVNEQMRIPETSWFGFDPQPAILGLWFIWSQEPMQELEDLRIWLNDRDRGSVRDADVRTRIRRILADLAVNPLASKSGGTEETIGASTRRFAWKVRLETKADVALTRN